jgi:hypothetical protein
MFQSTHSVGSEVPPVDQRRHPHRDDDPRRPAREQRSGKAVLAVLEGDARAHHLFEKRLQKSRHRAMPKREDDNQVLRRHDPVARPDQRLRPITPLELLLGAQDREV